MIENHITLKTMVTTMHEEAECCASKDLVDI